jgi:hypothetical protein
VVINYLDRANLSIAGPALAKELAIHSIRMNAENTSQIHPCKVYAVLIALSGKAEIPSGHRSR